MVRRALPVFGGLMLGLGLGIVILFAFLNPSEISEMNDSPPGTESHTNLVLGAPAPDFKLTTLAGEQVRLKDYQGQVVLLNFWATWCGPCRLEMLDFQSKAEQFAGELAVVAVNNSEEQSVVQAFVDDLGIQFDILLDPYAEVQHLYRVRGYPTSYLLDAKGFIRVQHIGLMTENQLDEYLLEIGLMP